MTRFGAHIYESGTTRLGGSEIILLVKDPPTVRELFQAMLCKDGYRVLAAPQTVDFGTIRRILFDYEESAGYSLTCVRVSGTGCWVSRKRRHRSRNGSWPPGSRLEFGRTGGVVGAKSSRLGSSMSFRAIKISKVARAWGLVLVAGLVAGLFGVWIDGWHTGDTIGLIVWCILLLCVLDVVRRENRVLGRLGGQTRAKNLAPERRLEIARKASNAAAKARSARVKKVSGRE
jgi:hypothetical protein